MGAADSTELISGILLHAMQQFIPPTDLEIVLLPSATLACSCSLFCTHKATIAAIGIK